jgi:hypothetical protein
LPKKCCFWYSVYIVTESIPSTDTSVINGALFESCSGVATLLIPKYAIHCNRTIISLFCLNVIILSYIRIFRLKITIKLNSIVIFSTSRLSRGVVCRAVPATQARSELNKGVLPFIFVSEVNDMCRCCTQSCVSAENTWRLILRDVIRNKLKMCARSVVPTEWPHKTRAAIQSREVLYGPWAHSKN